MPQPQRLLCPIDFSEVSLKAARYAAELAAKLGGSLKLLYVYHVPLHVSPVGAPPRHFADLSRDELAELERSLDTLKGQLAELGAPVETAIAVGAPAQQVVEAAKANPTDLIVIGSVGRSGIRDLLLGSVAERVLRTSPVPVLVVPA